MTFRWQSCSCTIDGIVNLVSGRAVHVNAKAILGAGQAVSVEGRVFPQIITDDRLVLIADNVLVAGRVILVAGRMFL